MKSLSGMNTFNCPGQPTLKRRKWPAPSPKSRGLSWKENMLRGSIWHPKPLLQTGFPEGQGEHDWLNAFIMNIDIPKDGAIKNYLRTVDFESGEVKVLWEDNRGAWERNTFVSRPDNVVAQLTCRA